MKKITKSLLLFLTMVLLCFAMASMVSAETYSGSCGENLTWEFDTQTGALTIDGTGDMDVYSYKFNDTYFSATAPWYNYHEYINSVELPDGLTSIGSCAFFSCYNLTSITIPDSVTTIGDSAFCFCDRLTNITIPDGVIKIGDGAFSNCKSFTSITIPDGVTSIADSAFYRCSNLTSITIPDSVTSIGDSAFEDCYNLTSIAIPEGVTSIGYRAFYYCSELASIRLPNSVISIDVQAFYQTAYYNNNANWENDVLYIDDCLIGSKIASGHYEIVRGIRLIAGGAFSYSSLNSIRIPDSVTNIGDYAFSCNSLVSITVEENNKYYSNDEYGVLFDKNKTTLIQYPIESQMTSYVIPNSVITIGCGAFEFSSRLTDIIIPDSVTTIDEYAFSSCYSLTSIMIPDSITIIGKSVFSYCDNLTSVTIPDSVTSIGCDAFINCNSLASITIPDSVITIEEDAFCGCDILTNITIPDSVTNIGEHAFGYYGTRTAETDTTYHKYDQFIIKGTDGSVAEKYAKDNGFTFVESVSHNHTYSSVVTKQPTCTKEGIKTYTCTCGDTYTESIKKLDHKIISKTTKATFTTNGGYKKICENCDQIFGEGIYYKVDIAKLTTTKYTYDGKTKSPKVFIEDKMGYDFVEGEDYTIKYESGRKLPGKYAVTITLKGNYKGEKTLWFSILPGKTEKFVASQTTSSITLKWRKVKGATGYRVYQYNSKTGKYEKLKNTTGTTYTVKKLKAGTSYKFAVKAYSKDGSETLWASSYKTLTTATKPATPTVKATAGSKSATISWNKVTGATGYVVYMQDDFGDYVKWGSTKKTSCTKKSLKSGKTYYFRVRAYKTVDGKNIYGGYKTVKVKVK